MREKRIIKNETGKELSIMINPKDTCQHIHSEVEWTITPSQWRRLVRESDNSAWMTWRGVTIKWTCYPYAHGCLFPGRK